MIIETMIQQKRFFNANDKKDLNEAKCFFETHKWKNVCPFILEFPYLTVPDMIKDKMVHKALKIKYNRQHHWIKHAEKIRGIL